MKSPLALSGIFSFDDKTDAKTGPYVSAMGFIKVAPGVSNQSRPGCPAASAKNLACLKPWFRILFVRITHESGIGQEITLVKELAKLTFPVRLVKEVPEICCRLLPLITHSALPDSLTGVSLQE